MLELNLVVKKCLPTILWHGKIQCLHKNTIAPHTWGLKNISQMIYEKCLWFKGEDAKELLWMGQHFHCLNIFNKAAASLPVLPQLTYSIVIQNHLWQNWKSSLFSVICKVFSVVMETCKSQRMVICANKLCVALALIWSDLKKKRWNSEILRTKCVTILWS